MKRLFIFLAIISGVALVWAAPPPDKLPPLIGPPEALARITTVVVGGSPPAAGGAPTLSSATIPTTGKTISLVFSESVSVGAGGNGGFVLTPSETGVSAVMTYASGSGTNTLVYNLDRYIVDPETATLTYTQPSNGIEATTGGTDVTSFTDYAVTNNSTVPTPDLYCKAEASDTNEYYTGSRSEGNWSIYGGASSSQSQNNTSTTALKGTRSFAPNDDEKVLITPSIPDTVFEDGVFTYQFAMRCNDAGSFGSAFVRLVTESVSDNQVGIRSNGGSATSYLVNVAGTQYTVTLDTPMNATWTVIRVVVNTGAASDKLTVYQGASEAALSLKYESDATAVSAPSFASNPTILFGGNTEATKGVQVAGCLMDEMKIWNAAVTP